MIITSKDNPKVKEALLAKEAKDGRFLVEGFHLAEMAVAARQAVAVFSREPYECDCPNYIVNEAIIKKLASSVTPEGIVVLCQKKDERRPLGDRVLYLDEVADPGNVGTLLRTALAFGFRDVYLSKGCASPFKAKALAASQGAIFPLAIHENAGIENLLSLKDKGFVLYGTALRDSEPLETAEAPEKLALILGNEARGIRPEILAVTDKNLRIDIRDIESLNVAMAGAIACHTFRK